MLQKLRKNRKGFTLIELIVVIAILGILAAILIPQFTGFQDKAKKTQVVTDSKQIATAVESLKAEGKIAANVAAAALDGTDPVIKLSGVPVGRITSLAYETDGGFTFVETPPDSAIAYTATRADSDTKIAITP